MWSGAASRERAFSDSQMETVRVMIRQYNNVAMLGVFVNQVDKEIFNDILSYMSRLMRNRKGDIVVHSTTRVENPLHELFRLIEQKGRLLENENELTASLKPESIAQIKKGLAAMKEAIDALLKQNYRDYLDNVYNPSIRAAQREQRKLEANQISLCIAISCLTTCVIPSNIFCTLANLCDMGESDCTLMLCTEPKERKENRPKGFSGFLMTPCLSMVQLGNQIKEDEEQIVNTCGPKAQRMEL